MPSYGVGNEMDSNYPIIELKDGSGHVYFARTFNWNSTGVATGSTPVTTDFTSPANMPYGVYSLYVVANGIASDPVPFTGGVVGSAADLAVTNHLVPTGTSEGDTLEYDLTATNNGFTSATKVVLTDTLGTNLKYVGGYTGQGTAKVSANVVTFSFGTVAVGQTVIARIYAQAIEEGNLTNTASVTSSVFDADTTNNTRTVTTAVTEGPIVVSAPITVSGTKQSGIAVATFTHVNGLEPASDFVATIDWGDGTTSLGTISQGKGNKSSTYTVKGSHTYSTGGTHTVTTTVVEASSGGGSMSALALMSGSSSSTPTSDIVPMVQSQTVPPGIALRTLKTASVDEAFGTTTFIRSRRAIRAAANDTTLDDLFASV